MKNTQNKLNFIKMTTKEKIDNLEFKITFSETNLRYLAGEPDGENNRALKAANLAGIESALAAIAASEADYARAADAYAIAKAEGQA
jgi:hypothetical protein